jgi:acetyl esterase
MPLDFRLQFILWLQSLRKEPSVNSVTDYRNTFNRSVAQFTRLTAGRPEPVWKVENTLADTSDGLVPIRIYTPRPEAGLPILLYYHGGGFVVGTLDLYDRTCRILARYIDCIVISVDYRLAPEHPFPAAANDAYELALWTARNAENLGGDAQRMAVMGDSAGANLATVTAMQVRDKGGPNLGCQY